MSQLEKNVIFKTLEFYFPRDYVFSSLYKNLTCPLSYQILLI